MRFLHVGQPGTTTPRPPCATEGGSSTYIENRGGEFLCGVRRTVRTSSWSLLWLQERNGELEYHGYSVIFCDRHRQQINRSQNEHRSRNSSSIVLKFDPHHRRLGNIAWLARFLDGAIERMANALPNKVEFIDAQDKMVASFQMFGECVEPPHQFDPEEIKSCLLLT